MVYISSFFLYLCVDLCYNSHFLPYKISMNSDRQPWAERPFFNVCKHCNRKWLASPIGNASEYTKFFLFSRKTGLNYSEIVLGDVSNFKKSGFDLNKSTKLLIHGWLDNGLIHFPAVARDAYLAVEDVNIISVDWSRLAYTFYPLARVAVDPVGRYVAALLDWLVLQIGVSVESIHLIGHSLGAHIAGVAGEHVTCGHLNRITGLDPAGPGFDFQREGRLDSSDAEFVDVIHTAGLWAGYYDACGHIDFYPNGGIPDQPGCPIDWGTCSHVRSWKLFNESISSTGFVARECENWWDYEKGHCDNATSAVLGEHVDISARGKFYLRTGSHYPYALGNTTDTS